MRPAWTTPRESTSTTLAALKPSSTKKSTQAIAAAPAPDTTSLMSASALPASSEALSSPAPEMIAVPC